MRLPISVGLTLRTLLAVGINAIVLIVTVAFIVGWTALILLNLAAEPSDLGAWTVALASGTLLALPALTWVVRRTIRTERQRLLEDTTSLLAGGRDDADSLASVIRRLATQFDVPEPDVRIHSTKTPLAYTTYRPTDPIVRTPRVTAPSIVVSTGLLDSLRPAELEGVIAHEFAHIGNGDLQLRSWILVPLVAAELLRPDEGSSSTIFGLVGGVLAAVASISVGMFSRSRELAADRGAAAATGKPEALAAALEKLDDSRPEKPTEDLRTHARTTSAVNILPAYSTQCTSVGVLSTHPPLDTRLEQLSSIARE